MCRGGDGSPRFFCLLHDCINFHFGVYIVSNGKFCGTWRTYKYDLTGSFESKLMENIPTWKGGWKNSKKTSTAEQIVARLGQIEVAVANGKTIPQACKDLAISQQRDYRWRKEYGGVCSSIKPSGCRHWSGRPIPAIAAATPRRGSPPFPGWAWLPATATMTSVGDTRQFKYARQMATLLGVVPRQHSSGGKPMLLGKSQAWRRLPPYAGHPQRPLDATLCRGKTARRSALAHLGHAAR